MPNLKKKKKVEPDDPKQSARFIVPSGLRTPMGKKPLKRLCTTSSSPIDKPDCF
jgi:hypothetical protein